MANPSRQWLIQSLRTRLIPALEQRGFSCMPLAGEDARSGEIRTTFPLGRLCRPTPAGLDLVEIQLDKRGRPAFRLNIGMALAGGIQHAAGHVAQRDIWVHYLDRYFTMYQRPWFRQWFTVSRWSREPETAARYDALVDKAVALVPEIDQALTSGRPGPHLRAVG